MAETSEAPKIPTRAARWPLAISVAATIAILVIATALILELRDNVGNRARESADNLLHVIERDIARNVEVLDLSLQAIVDGMGRPDVMGMDPELRRLVLFDRSGSASGLGALVAVDTAGRIVLDSHSSVPRSTEPVTDRDYFQAHLNPGAGLFISRPHHSRLIDKDVIALSRRISDPDGGFAGVALATIELSYFKDLLSRLQLGSSGIVSLIRNDGAIIVRQSAGAAVIRSDVSSGVVLDMFRRDTSGTFTGVSTIDGVERFYSFSRIGDLPLTVSVGLAIRDIYGEWANQAFLIALALCLICAGIIALTVRLTKELGRRVAAEMTLVSANAELARLSTTDSLTRLGNRRLFDKSLDRELRRAKRTGRRVSLVLIDVDHFKRFNDAYGHPAGDETLTLIGRILARCGIRPADAAFRVGGEEFALILPETDLAGAMRVAERVAMEVRALRRPHTGSPLGHVSVSLGVAEVQDDDAASAYERADAALYRAKQAGRNRALPAERGPIAA